ncbi:aminotransferase class I/II-fold pyridoxal phosphate-dependent enzyme [Paroceanicella profunda]|uniref:Aminotransferase class I/II-fold pyridoxal phosphate-dependent enzyme n=2 Tax=Paroceanicella profunda TaxID=2579971 RepID=A0A5B8G3Z3_9RHOB|nr:aminotransferase class I/II-fold pyridoxal phosphate-dependent enzyme [Paroceanicella profunda]
MGAARPWMSDISSARVRELTSALAGLDASGTVARVETLAARSREIHERECFNLNPATNVMNPRAEALLSAGLGTRPSLGHPGEKYETGLEAIEEIEVICAALCEQVFDAAHVEFRVASGAMANLYAFMATCRPGDRIIVPPAAIGGHVTHHAPGAAGLYGLEVHEAPVSADGYSVDADALAEMAQALRPALITLGGSLNLFPHPVAELRAIAESVGARLLFDAAHLCGMIAGGAWENPLDLGAHLMTMSTYKSLGGPAGGLVLTRDPEIAARLDAIAYPGLTANFDAGRVAALAVGMVDWQVHGRAYAAEMVALARGLADALAAEGIPLFAAARGATRSHQFAVEAAGFGGGQAASARLRAAGFLTCGIGLPAAPVAGDLNGLRIGTPEMVRWGMTAADAPRLAGLLARALRANDPAALAPEVREWRAGFDRLHFICAE